MANGLNISKLDFQRLPQKQQLTLLYENTERCNVKLDDVKNMVRGYKKELWMHRAMILVLFVLTGFGKFIGVI